MDIEIIQQALFSAYDIKYNLNMSEKCRVINQDSGELLIDALNQVIETLELAESHLEREGA